MKPIDEFFKWFTSHGGKYVEGQEEFISKRLVPVPDPVSSFKERAGEIKRKYNYRFQFKPEPRRDIDLHNYPDIDKIKFEKK